MSEELVEEAVLEPVIEEAPAQNDAPVKRTKAKKIVEKTKEDVKEEVDQNVISGPKKTKAASVSNVHSKESGAIGSHAADRALSKKIETKVKEEKQDESEKVAIWSEKNVRWSDVGTISKGYNIVSKEAAAKWLTKGGIRKATPEEVATYYGK
jgi:hypothetical protein